MTDLGLSLFEGRRGLAQAFVDVIMLLVITLLVIILLVIMLLVIRLFHIFA